MENGKLKIKESGKIVLVVGKFDGTPPKEFDFQGLPIGNHECQVERIGGAITRIVLDGKDVPKKDLEVQRKAEQAKRREQEETKRKEEEQLRHKEAQRPQNTPQIINTPQIRDSYDLTKAQVPSDTRRDGDPSVIENFALKFYKFARFEQNHEDTSKSKFQFFKTERGRIDYALKPDFNKINFTALTHREKQNAELLVNHLELKTFTPNWRLAVGLGGDSVYETGMTLHHIYGFPYIPASAVKGVLRSYIIQTIFLPEFEGQDKAGKEAEKKALKDSQFEKVFGSTDQQGKAIFFDAFPTEIPKLKPDIMNVHYKDWYSEGKAPTDTQQLNPILFLTVESTPFQFLIGSKEIVGLKFQDKTLMSWLTSALEEHGIGAKTAVGYGYMQ